MNKRRFFSALIASLIATLMVIMFTSCAQTCQRIKANGSIIGTVSAPFSISPLEIIRKNAETYLKDRMNDPSSYQFVSLRILDTVTYKQNIEENKNYARQRINEDKDMMRMFPNDKKIDLIKDKIILSKLDSIEKSLGKEINHPAGYLFIYSFRAKNGFGGLVLNEYYLQVSASDLSTLNITDDRDKLYTETGGFPGRETIYK